jgi:hypothetical protein
MLFQSLEIRWFSENPIPATERWFEKYDLISAAQDIRTDYYLIPALSKGMGIKLREGKIEIKSRLAKSIAKDILPNVSGLEERYQKWSFPINESTEEFQKLISDSTNWLPVIKERRALILDDSDNSDIQNRIHAPGTILQAGCQFEYTRIFISNKTFFTIGLECFGKDYSGPDLMTLRDFFGDSELSLNNSMGYVDFLQIQAQVD